MTPIDQVHILKHKQTYLGDEVMNVYAYLCDEGMTSVDLNLAFQEDVLPAIAAIQGGLLTSVELDSYSLGNLADLDVLPAPAINGYPSADTLPIFNSVGYSLRSTTRAVRAGSKRYSGIPETVQIRGEITDATYLGQMETLRIALDTLISDDDTLFATPIIVKRVKYEVPGSDPVRFAYRFPETDEELVYALIRGVFTSPHITHQVSRNA